MVHAKIQHSSKAETAAASVLHILTTFRGFLLGAALLVEQDGGDEDHHLHHDGDEGLQRLVERDDLEAAGTEGCKEGRGKHWSSNVIHLHYHKSDSKHNIVTLSPCASM